MRDKTLQLMKYTVTSFDEVVEGVAGNFRAQFKEGFGEDMPPEAAEALATIEGALRAGREARDQKIAEIYETHFTEEQIEALVAFYESPAGQRLSEVGQAVQNALIMSSDEWLKDCMKGIESDLARHLGDPAQVPEPKQAETAA